MDTLCRVCIKKAAKCTLLNTKIENSSSLSFFDFLNKCTSLNACESDKLPQGLCSICTHSIKTFYSFVKLAEKSDIILREASKNSLTTGRYNDNREISCEEITIASGKIKQEPEGFCKEESLHSQTSRSSTGSSLYILDLVKEEPGISESTLIVEFKGTGINESEKLHCNLDHAEGSVDESDDILLCIDHRLASKEVAKEGAPYPGGVCSSDRLIDNRGIFCEEITIRNEKIKEESEELNKEESLHCQTSKNSTGSSLYILNIEKEEPREEPDDTLSCIDGDLTSIDTEYSESEDDVPIDLLKRRVKNEDETDSQSTKIKYEDHFRIGHGSRNQFSSEAKDNSFEPHLQHHLLTHDEKKKYECSICGKGFKRSSNRSLHMKKHSGERPFKCEICGKKFMSKHYLNVHIENHKGIKKKCGQCDKEFKNSDSLRKHMKWHTNPKCEKCEICGKKFSTKQYLNFHMENHKGIKRKCDQCDKEFTNSLSLKMHMNLHTEQCEKCEICNKIFSTKHYLKRHMENHSGVTKKCHQCDKEFTNIYALRNHMKRHAEPKCGKCEICGRTFSSKHYLSVHMENHKGIKKKCGQCDKEFKNSESLRKHMKWHTEQCEKCEICSKKFSTKHDLKLHMVSHNGIIKKCDQCHKEYTNSNALRRHMKRHTGSKCEICSKQFSTKHYLNIHMENHNGITKKCDECNKEFKNSYSLSRHMKLHTNPKPFKCENCGKSLSRRDHYTRHIGICKPVGNSIEEALT